MISSARQPGLSEAGPEETLRGARTAATLRPKSEGNECMAEGRRGLGRGLSALLDEAETAHVAAAPADGELEIPIELVARNPEQPRQSFPQPSSLSWPSPSAKGGCPADPGATAGDRRRSLRDRRRRTTLAGGPAGRPAGPSRCRPRPDDEHARDRHHRERPAQRPERAGGGARLRDLGSASAVPGSLAPAVGKSRSHVANTLRLLRLPKRADQLSAGRLTAGHARALLDLAQAEAVARHVIDRGLNVRQTEAFKKAGGAPTPEPSWPARGRKTPTRAIWKLISLTPWVWRRSRDVGGAGEVRACEPGTTRRYLPASVASAAWRAHGRVGSVQSQTPGPGSDGQRQAFCDQAIGGYGSLAGTVPAIGISVWQRSGSLRRSTHSSDEGIHVEFLQNTPVDLSACCRPAPLVQDLLAAAGRGENRARGRPPVRAGHLFGPPQPPDPGPNPAAKGVHGRRCERSLRFDADKRVETRPVADRPLPGPKNKTSRSISCLARRRSGGSMSANRSSASASRPRRSCKLSRE